MKLDLEKNFAPDRRCTNSSKWDGLASKFGEADLIPLWVADMDFKAPECVQNALQKMIDLGVYGYYMEPDSYYEAFIFWEKRHHGYEVKKEWLRYTTGVVSGLYWFVNILTRPGDACVILSPCYYPFMDAIRDTGRKLVCCSLVNKDGCYTIDYTSFEEAIINNNVKLFLLCSPHNPVGRVWTRDELKSLLMMCKKRGVFVVSDEIHQDIVMSGYKHIPSASVGAYDEMLVTLTAASKTFNLAGCQNSFAVIPDKTIREKFDQFIKSIRAIRGSMFGYAAVEAAYSQGEPWLKEVLEIIEGNYKYLRDALLAELPEIVVTPLEGTYLMWIDLGAYVPYEKLQEIVQEKSRLAVDYGAWFLEKGADTHIRVNLATPRKNIETAAENLIREIKGLGVL